jgi:hypothetical protein
VFDGAGVEPWNTASAIDTTCSTCSEDFYVSTKICTACPSHSTNDSGNDSNGDDTACRCAADYQVVSKVCTKCNDDGKHAAGDKLDGGDSFCNCNVNTYVTSTKECKKCPDNSTNTAGNSNAGPTYCTCSANFIKKGSSCEACDADAGLESEGGSLEGDKDGKCLCKANYYVKDAACVKCENDGTKDAGDDPSVEGANTKDKCGAGTPAATFIFGVCTLN